MASDATVRWPIGRVAMVAVLPLLGVLATLGWLYGFYANSMLALLLAIWATATVALAMRREARPVASDALFARRSAEAEREQRRLTAYLNLSPAPLVTLEEGYRLRAVNRAARRMFGVDDVLPDPDAVLVRAIDDTAPGRAATVRLNLGNGTQAYALATADIVGAGSVSRIAALVDIDAELRAAEAGALRELLQVLSHEIMNALTPIASLGRSAADLIDSDAPEDRAAAREAVETVARRAEGLHRFGSAYRALARLPAPEMRRFPLDALLDDIERLFATRWPATSLRIDRSAAPEMLSADPDQINAALWALLQNAAEALADRPDGRVTLRIGQDMRGVRISVADNGPGVAEAVRDRVFQPFFTTKQQGSGVGLAMVQQIVLGHQGSVTLDASTGSGACIHISLPIATA